MSFVNTSLFVGDLPKFCSESDLEQFFAPFGPVLDVKIKRNVNTGKTLSYGFVTLSNEAIAAEALSATDGAMFLGRKLRVRWAMYNAKTQNPTSQNVINSVYVRFVTPKIEEYVTEEDLHRVFDPFGSVLDVSIKESAIDVRSNRQSGYGFVHFSCDSVGIEAAFQAVAALDNSTINDITYNVELSKNLLKQFNSNPELTATPNHNHSIVKDLPLTASIQSNPSPSKVLSTPSRSMNNIYQSSPLSVSSPHKVSAEVFAAPVQQGFGDQAVYRSPLRNCSSMNAIKPIPSPLQSSYGTTHAEVTFSPASHSFSVGVRGDRNNVLAKPGMQANTYLPNSSMQVPTGTGYNKHGNNFSRENSFRSMGGRSASGSFRTLHARSSSANSMTSSYGTTVSCTSTPSPFVNVPLESSVALDKTQSFRSDPGALRVHGPNSGRFPCPIAASPRHAIGSAHSLSFHDSPLSQGLFSRHGSEFSSHSHSLLSVPGQNLSELDLVWNSSLHQYEPQHPVKRPDSRCSDVSTDSEEEAVLVSGFEFFSANNKDSDDFFALLSSKDKKAPAVNIGSFGVASHATFPEEDASLAMQSLSLSDPSPGSLF